MDVWYVDNVSIWVDIKIIFLTIKNVLMREDIGEGGSDMVDIDDLGIEDRIIAYKKEHNL